MHPIERLRYVARAGSAPDRVLVAEAVPAITSFAHDPGALLVALRQLISRQPESPGLLVLGARVLGGLDPVDAAWGLVDELDADPTLDLAAALPLPGAGGPEIIDSLASTSEDVLCPHGTGEWLARARSEGLDVVVTTPLGSRLPRLLWSAHLERQALGGPGPEVLPASAFDGLVGPDGRQPWARWSADCIDVAEIASF